MGVRFDPASLMSIPSWAAEVIMSEVVSQLWGLEACMNCINLISPEQESSHHIFCITLLH